ncbi:hypothetical protein CDO52_24145 [Nocardiopsis gilva YIM 90087]|uniref:Uncharacterized protein n=1 Tax=Nocardiopsis gilva YIM 90087 TaxID=1235441 RepID=A0A223SBD5_9ACTN|nr:hypothetical protein [Nocardiopsis gilva]ASU85478.1 hypothetical protein CDO52_24145 [Nocardiopsis gilva YIM 90087]
MNAEKDYEALRELMDRLPPAGLRRLRALAESDSEIAQLQDEGDEDAPKRFLPFIGKFDSGRSDISIRHHEIMLEEFGRPE